MMSKRGILRDPIQRAIIRVDLLRRGGRHCHWCGDRMTWQVGAHPHAGDMTFEHLRRRRDGGGNRRHNLVLACLSCNKERN